MPTDSLHPDQAQPYYMTIPVEEYESMKKRISELEKLTQPQKTQNVKR